MIKRFLTVALLVSASFWSLASIAADSHAMGVVNVRQIFSSSPQMKKMSESMKKRFSAQKATIDAMGAKLAADIEKYQKNKAVMKQSDADALTKKIAAQEKAYRGKQMQFQQQVYAAQNKVMSDFMDKVKAAAKVVAEKKHLSIVLASSNVLYSGDSADITQDVLKKVDG